MRIGSLFTGYGGLDLAVADVLGADVAWHCEVDPAPSSILAHHFPGVPNHGDVAAVDWSAVEPVDVLTGGFPCQDVSGGGKRLGLRPGTRSGLWSQFAYAIDQLRPALVVIENVRGLLSAAAHCDLEPCPWCVGDDGGVPLRALGAVLGDLAALGYDAQWCGVSASDVDAPHGRFRVFIAAQPADTDRARLAGTQSAPGRHLFARRAAAAQDSDVAASGERRLAAPRQEEGGRARPDTGRRGRAPVDWGDYELAVRRWERRLGRPAPAPTAPSTTGASRLSPEFVEWMMGLPAGWVTDVPGLSRNDQLKALGNGVVPLQAATALEALLATQEIAA